MSAWRVPQRWLAVAALGVFVCAFPPRTTAIAAGNVSQGQVIDVSAAIGPRYAPPSGYWVDPCAEGSTFERVLDVGSLPGGGSAIGTTRTAPDGVVERAVVTYCRDDEFGDVVPGTLTIFWIGVPDPADLVPAVFAYLPDYLDPPVVEWPNMSPDRGWLFVKVPMDFRVNNLAPVTVTAIATNILGQTATASVTATPDRVVFTSGEGSGSAECSAEEAQSAYAPGAPGACSYRYVNSSAVVGGQFGTRTTMYWAVTSNPFDATQPTELDTWSEQALAVSEVQAVVTCSGSGC